MLVPNESETEAENKHEGLHDNRHSNVINDRFMLLHRSGRTATLVCTSHASH